MDGPRKRFMSNIPGVLNYLPGADPIIELKIGTEEGRLITDNVGYDFFVEGDISIAALAVLKHVMNQFVFGSNYSAYDPAQNKITELHFSRFKFDFNKGIKVTILPGKESEDTIIFFKELEKMLDRVLNMKAFL